MKSKIHQKPYIKIQI